jgi:cbb3-type cytochrome oxidase maturation protein
VSILYLLIPLAVILMIVAAAFFIWTVKHGQYDDLEGPAHRILMDDDDPLIPGNAPKQRANTDPASTPKAGGAAKQPENRDQGA